MGVSGTTNACVDRLVCSWGESLDGPAATRTRTRAHTQRHTRTHMTRVQSACTHSPHEMLQAGLMQ
jgi:hypothetical protein